MKTFAWGMMAVLWACAFGLAMAGEQEARPRLLDLGSKACIPCKLMAPILEELKTECAGKFDVQFIDVNEKENIVLAKQYNINLIPTQIFLDATGKELFRHEGFISKHDILARWRKLNVDIGPELQAFSRLEPLKADDRPKTSICYMCDRDLNPKTTVTVGTAKGNVRLCSPHCFFILYSCMTEDRTGLEEKVKVADFQTGKELPIASAVMLYGADEKTGQPWVKAFETREAALAERQVAGGNVTPYAVLKAKELSHRCGFCDRAVYPEEAALVKAEGVYTWGCCSHCALGVAARMGKDIEVHQRDGLTGEEIVVKTLGGCIASIEPKTAVAWFGQRKTAEGKWVSAGCFHQGFFMNEENLKKWLEARPYATGRLISIDRALWDKMQMSPAQIAKACKVGECAPK